MRKTARRRAAAVLSALALGLAASLTACSPSGDGNTGGGSADTMRIWWYEPADSAQHASWTRSLEQFKKDHPEVTVEFESKSWEQLQKAGQMVLNSAEAPDILEYPKGNAATGAVAAAGLLTDMSDAAKERGWRDTVAPGVLAVGEYENGIMGSGGLYGVPTYAEYASVFYNIDMLKAKGFEPPKTVEEWEEQMAAFQADGVTPLALGGAGYPIVHLIHALALSKGSREWIDNFTFLRGDVDFHDEAWTFGAEKAAEWAEKGYIGSDATGIDAEGAGAAFKAGTSPYFLSGSWWLGDFAKNISDFEWTTFPNPGNGYTPGSGGNVWVVPANSKHKDLAYEFIDLLLSTEAQTDLANAGGVAVAADMAKVTDPIGQLANSDMQRLIDEDLLGYNADWPVAGYYDLWLSQSQSLITGGVTPEQFLTTLGDFYHAGRAELGRG